MQLTSTLIDEIMNARLSPAELSDVLRQLTPETIEADAFPLIVEAAHKVCAYPELDKQISSGTIDCSGTGGSGLQHFNVSTTVAFVLAAAGLKVTKFGNKAMSGLSGSFDLLNALDIDAITKTVKIEDALSEIGVVFLFAPNFYPTLKGLSEVRRSLGIKTIFNFIGPLLNPVRPEFRLMGVSNSHMQILVAKYLEHAPMLSRALVVRGENGLDEMAYPETTKILTVENHKTIESLYAITAAERLQSTPLDQSLKLDTQENIRIFKAILSGEEADSVCFKQVTLNAGAGLVTCGKAKSIKEGQNIAESLIFSGKVQQKYEETKRFYAKHSC